MAAEPSGGQTGNRFSALARRPGERWGQFAERVGNAFGLVFLLIILAYVLGSLVPYRGWTGVLTTAVAAGAAVIALGSAGARRRAVRSAGFLAIASVTLAVLAAILDEPQLLGSSAVVQVLLLLVAAGAVLRAVVTAPEVDFRTILGALSVYMTFGLLFTFLYAFLDKIQDGAFFANGAAASGGDTIFFSFTTLTTTGYGNLVPAAQPGKMFAGLEMLIGQIFLVTLVAGLVSLWRPRRVRSSTEG
ncbi:MAG TPA: ion channel [Solirubrobacterales bacterium]|nr:ion channel [Solirubrobacterales bacterium]